MKDTMRTGLQQVRAQETTGQLSEPTSAVASSNSSYVGYANATSETSRAGAETVAAHSAYLNAAAFAPQPKRSRSPDNLNRYALTRNNSESTTSYSEGNQSFQKSHSTTLGAPRKKVGDYFSEYIEVGRSSSASSSEGAAAKATIKAAKEALQAHRAARAGKPSKTGQERFIEWKETGRSDSASPGDGELLKLSVNKAKQKTRQFVERRAARKAGEGKARAEAAQAPAGQVHYNQSAPDELPIWHENARAAEYQQAIAGITEKTDPRYSMIPESCSPQPSASSHFTGSRGHYDSFQRESSDTSYSGLSNRTLHSSDPSYPRKMTYQTSLAKSGAFLNTSSEGDTLVSAGKATAAFGKKLFNKFNTIGEKRDLEKEKKKEGEAEARRAYLKGTISGPVEAQGSGPLHGWEFESSFPHLEIEVKEQAAKQQPFRPALEPIDFPHQRSQPEIAPRRKHQTHNTTFSQFINDASAHQEIPPVPPMPTIPSSKSEKSKGKQLASGKSAGTSLSKDLGHKLEDVAGTLRKNMPHAPRLRRAASDDSFGCIGAGVHPDGTLVMPELPPENRRPSIRDTNADIIAAYGHRTPGIEVFPGPGIWNPNDPKTRGKLEQDQERVVGADIKAAQQVSIMPDSITHSRSGKPEVQPRAGLKRDTIADFSAFAAMPGHFDVGSKRNDAAERVDSMAPAHRIAPQPKQSAPHSPRDSAYVSVYSRDDGSLVKERTSPVSPLTPRESWEIDEDEPYIPPRQEWHNRQKQEKSDTASRAGDRRRAPGNSYYRMVERDRKGFL